MIPREQLNSAVTAGILSAAQADALAFHLDPATKSHDPEEVRFARGFHDIFISIGIGILLIGAYYGVAGVLPADLAQAGPAPFVAALVWGLRKSSSRGCGWPCRRSCWRWPLRRLWWWRF
ncbi:hypothetical protein [Breoghania sp. L-A4]|uniref:hypothetical protein n=1 Tax=Breoghania sp. L-A4 TaxID=2304600 RepID=UPI000E35B925|nr:hypothetical protein [Breoghania sp. L-A4]AXS38994.1 hypothetical protein D1F64_01585 [Breoghania sp. L-A4]